MLDQAAKLRKLVEKKKLKSTITVTSGKGGVGKSNISLNLGINLAQKGYRICLFDGDFSLSNLNILLGDYFPKNLSHYINSEILSLKEIIYPTKYENLFLLPGGSGIEKLAALGENELNVILDKLSEIEDMFDYLIIDTAAGIHPTVLKFLKASDMNILVMTPEPTSLSDAYALYKIIINENENFAVVMNMAKSLHEGKSFYKKFSDITMKFLHKKSPLLGVINYDENVKNSVKKQEPVISLKPDSSFSLIINKITVYLISRREDNTKFFKNFLR